LPGSVEAKVISGGLVKCFWLLTFIGNISAKKISKSVHECQSYSKPKVGHFLRHGVYRFSLSALTLLVGWQEGHPVCKAEWWGTCMVICLQRGANDLHMIQLMPLPPPPHHLLLQ